MSGMEKLGALGGVAVRDLQQWHVRKALRELTDRPRRGSRALKLTAGAVDQMRALQGSTKVTP